MAFIVSLEMLLPILMLTFAFASDNLNADAIVPESMDVVQEYAGPSAEIKTAAQLYDNKLAELAQAGAAEAGPPTKEMKQKFEAAHKIVVQERKIKYHYPQPLRTRFIWVFT
jgi:hypothetical protein